jgi:hypothetical protein
MRNKILMTGVTALITIVVAVTLYRQYYSSCTVSAQESEMKPIARTNEERGAVTQPEESPFACDMTALDAKGRERHAVVTRQLNDGVQEVRELPDGYALRFTPSQESILLVSEFIARERLCCPFFSFELQVEKDGGPVWLQLRGREGVKAFIQAELKW